MTAVAAIQLVSGAHVEANLARAGELVAEAAAQGARLIVLPENFACMPAEDAQRAAIAEEPGAGPVQEFLARTAKTHAVWLVGGTAPLKGGGGKTRAASLVLDPAGRCVARYDKIHLFDVQLRNGEQYRESNWIEPGSGPAVVDTPAGRLGLSVCYDLRFPELYRRLLAEGAELFAVPSAFTAYTGKAHWETLLRARAIENLAYVIAPNQGGSHPGGRVTYGHSMIIGPWGDVLARVPEGEGIAIAQCDVQELERTRASLPCIQHRRI